MATTNRQDAIKKASERQLGAGKAMAQASGLGDLIEGTKELTKLDAELAGNLTKQAAEIESRAFDRKIQAEKDLKAQEIKASAVEQQRSSSDQAMDRDKRFQQMMQIAKEGNQKQTGQPVRSFTFSSTKRTGGGSKSQDVREMIRAQQPQMPRQKTYIPSVAQAPNQRQRGMSGGFGYVNQFLGLADFGQIRGDY